MKQIRISSYLLIEVSNSIGIYVSKELKNNKQFRDLNILRSFVYLTRKLNALNESNDKNNDYIEIGVDDNVTMYLPDLIGKYIFDEIADYSDPDFDWVCEMMSILDQLTDNDTDAAYDIGYEKKEPLKTDISNGEMKNRDIIEELNSETSEKTDNAEEHEKNPYVSEYEGEPSWSYKNEEESEDIDLY